MVIAIKLGQIAKLGSQFYLALIIGFGALC